MTESKIVKSLFTGGAIVFTGLVISKIFGLLYRIIVGRALGPEEYGIISVMLAVSSVIGALAYIGVPNGVQKYVSEYRGEQDKKKQVGIIRTGLILVTIPSVITGILLFLLAPWISIEIFNEERAIWPLRLLALILPLRAWRKTLIKTTEAYEKMQYRVYTNYLYGNIVKVVLTITLVLLGYGYIGAAFAYVFAWGSAIVLSLIFVNKLLPETFRSSIKPHRNYKKLLDHSWPLFAAGLFASIAGYIDTFMLQAFLGSEEVGLYNAAYPFAAAIAFAGSAFSSIYLSNASKLYGKGKISAIGSAYSLVVKWTALISVPIFFILLAFPNAVLQLFGPEYLEMNNVLRILALGFLFSALVGPAGKVIQAVDKTKYKLYLTLLIGTSNIVLNYLLIPSYEITGAAIATATTFIIAFVSKLLIVKYLINSFAFRPSVLKIIISASVSILITYLAFNRAVAETSIIILPTAITLFMLLYIFSILATKTLEKDDLKVLKYIKEKLGIKKQNTREYN